ncbi:sensor histidine kinase [Nibribacter koreensis]|uniref:histidine kinase n=1 Tax=Nibribacter koreensis TaxID=1084519 RepID=A0ABP8F707_9BACT
MNQELEQSSCQEQLARLKQEYEEFAYIVSHDLKAPLRAICNLSGWISEDLDQNIDPDIAHNIKLLQNRAERMERMINAVLSFSRVNRMELDIRPVDTGAVAREVAAPFMQSHGLRLTLEDMPSLTTYGKKFETVLAKLLQNAVTFNDAEVPEVHLTATDQGAYYTFKVTDNGIGISEDAKHKVFNLFYTVQPKDEEENLGAGLTIVRKIVQFVGGTIEAQSNAGKGTTFQFTWPKHIV